MDVSTLQGGAAPDEEAEEILLLMNYINGGSWYRLVSFALDNNYELPARFCYYVLRCILDAIIHLQSTYGVQHLDLHLADFMFDIEDGHVTPVFIDHGLTHSLDHGTWQKELSPSLSLKVPQIVNKRKAFQESFVPHIESMDGLSRLKLSLDALDELRVYCLT